MLSYDKIINTVSPEIISTINLLVKEGNTERLKNWLAECEKEIIFRDNEKINTYDLYCEKYYLQTVLNEG